MHYSHTCPCTHPPTCAPIHPPVRVLPSCGQSERRRGPGTTRGAWELDDANRTPRPGLTAPQLSLEVSPAQLRDSAARPVCVTQPGAQGAPAQGGRHRELWRCLEAPLHLLWRCWAGMSLASVSSILCRHLVRANVRVRVRSRLAARVTVTVGVTVKLGVGPRGWAGFLAPFVQAEPQPHAAALGVAQVRRTHEGRRLARWLTELPDGFVFVSRPGMGGLRPGCAA